LDDSCVERDPMNVLESFGNYKARGAKIEIAPLGSGGIDCLDIPPVENVIEFREPRLLSGRGAADRPG